MMVRSFAFLSLTLLAQQSVAWSPLPVFGSKKVFHSNIDLSTPTSPTTSTGTETDEETKCEVRRSFLRAAAMQICLLGGAPVAFAQDATVYKSGKTPIVPGQKPKDKNDVKGTRKDPDFLRSVADCRNQCQSSNGADGLAKSKEDCLSDCQDICCTTYEQCTFNIVPRL